jgi:hypothetical protein
MAPRKIKVYFHASREATRAICETLIKNHELLLLDNDQKPNNDQKP